MLTQQVILNNIPFLACTYSIVSTLILCITCRHKNCCSICQELLYPAFSLVPCGHSFCGVCILSLQTSHQESKHAHTYRTSAPLSASAASLPLPNGYGYSCPLCRASTISPAIQNITVQQMIEEEGERNSRSSDTIENTANVRRARKEEYLALVSQQAQTLITQHTEGSEQEQARFRQHHQSHNTSAQHTQHTFFTAHAQPRAHEAGRSRYSWFHESQTKIGVLIFVFLFIFFLWMNDDFESGYPQQDQDRRHGGEYNRNRRYHDGYDDGYY